MLKGKISPEEIAELKKEFDGEGLYRFSTVDNKHDVIFRALTTSIAREVQLMAERSEEVDRVTIDSSIFERCVIWPILSIPEYKRLPVGIVPSVVRSILDKSGFVGVDLNGNITGPTITTVKVADPVVWEAPTDAEIKGCQKEAGQLPIFKVKVGVYIFIVRPITRMDVESAATRVEQAGRICELVTLFPANPQWDKVPVGVIEALFNQTQILSGATNSRVEVEEL